MENGRRRIQRRVPDPWLQLFLALFDVRMTRRWEKPLPGSPGAPCRPGPPRPQPSVAHCDSRLVV